MNSKIYLAGFLVLFLFVFGCIKISSLDDFITDSSPAGSDDSDSDDSGQPGTSTGDLDSTPSDDSGGSPTPGDGDGSPSGGGDNSGGSQPKTTSAPDQSLLEATADYSSQDLPVTSSNYIDSVYALDLETYTAPRGRAMVAGKQYEIIAEDDQEFDDHVTFTVMIDGEEVDSFEATCPDYCASGNMYSVPLFINEGDYSEIYVIAEDGSGVRGESVVYQYAASEEEASYLAETCEVPDAIPTSLCSEGEDREVVFHGGTISNGWPDGTNAVPYNIDTNYSSICDEIDGGGGLGTGFFAQTRCRFSYRFCSDLAPVPDPVACTCDCTATIRESTTTVEINVDFPNWVQYDSGTQCEKDHWDAFLQNTKTHEEGHVTRCKDTKNNMDAQIPLLTGHATAATCQAACDTAFDRLKDNVDHTFNNEINDLNNEQATYDGATDHGGTQGAIIDCSDC